MKLRMIVETVTDQIQALAQRNSISPDEVKSLCQQASKDYWKWVLKQWFDGKISLPEDVERSQQVLSSFKSVLPRVPSDQRDIFKLKSLEEIESLIAPLLGVSSSKKSHKITGRPGVKLVNTNGPYETYEITDEETLKKLGEGTRWCTRGSHPKCAAGGYLKTYGKIFTILQNGRPVIQYTPDYSQVQDIENNKVKDPTLLALIPPPDPTHIKSAFNYAINVMKKRWPEAEPYIMKDPQRAYYYAFLVMGKRWPEAEAVILQDPHWAVSYAITVIDANNMKKRWPEAEAVILQDPEAANEYAIHILKKRWPEAEPYIMQDPKLAAKYAIQILKKKRWPEAEPYIMQDPKSAAKYAIQILKKKRWPEAEPYIMQDPESAAIYAIRILKERWPEAEPYIMQDPKSAAIYAIDILKERWPEAEPYIIQGPTSAAKYAKHFGFGSRKAMIQLLRQNRG